MNIMLGLLIFIMSVTSVRQTHERISVYPVTILSYCYPFSNLIMSLSYPTHQTGRKTLKRPNTNDDQLSGEAHDLRILLIFFILSICYP